MSIDFEGSPETDTNILKLPFLTKVIILCLVIHWKLLPKGGGQTKITKGGFKDGTD